MDGVCGRWLTQGLALSQSPNRKNTRMEDSQNSRLYVAWLDACHDRILQLRSEEVQDPRQGGKGVEITDLSHVTEKGVLALSVAC